MSKNISGGGILQAAFWCGLFIFLTFMGMSLWTSFIDSQVSKIALIEYKNLPYHCSGSGRSFYCTPRNVDLLQNATSLEKFWLGMRESYYLAGMLLSIS